MSDEDDVLLDAVREEVLAYGVRRATATSIAQRAGVSRVTVYRRGGGIKQLILDALVGEFARTIEQVARRVAEERAPTTGRQNVVEVTMGIIESLREAPLVGALLTHDPELLLPYLVDRYGRSQQLMLAALSAAIGEGMADGSIRGDDPDLAAQVLLHALTPFVVGSHILTATHAPDDVLREVRHLVDAYLSPTRPSGR
jgi:AcrR family transcriptional regulator